MLRLEMNNKTQKPYAEQCPYEEGETIKPSPDRFYVVISMHRFGANVFTHTMEYVYFPPWEPELNDQYQMQMLPWKETRWVIVGVPMGFSETAKKIARDCGMILKDGIPLFGESREPFPLSGPNVWTLENKERPAYWNTPYTKENDECKKNYSKGQDCRRDEGVKDFSSTLL